MNTNALKLNSEETKIFKRLQTPLKIQDFLDTLKINFEIKDETCSSPRTVFKRHSAHCIEAALLAAAILKFHNQPAFLLDLKANDQDFDHVVCLFKQNGRWGALSKSNHPPLRYRDPIYKTVRELAMSYFHEYLNMKGQKTLRSYSRPYGLSKYGYTWVTDSDNVWEIANDLDKIKHLKILPTGFLPRNATKFEKQANNLTEWK